MASWRGTTASLILYPSFRPAAPTSCSDLATHRRSRGMKSCRSTPPNSETFRLLEPESSHQEINYLRRIDHHREMVLARAGPPIRASDNGPPQTRRLATQMVPITLPPTPLTFQSDQRHQQAPLRKEHSKNRCQMRREVRAGGKSKPTGCPRTLHTAYRIRRHHTTDPLTYLYLHPLHQLSALASSRRNFFFDGHVSFPHISSD